MKKICFLLISFLGILFISSCEKITYQVELIVDNDIYQTLEVTANQSINYPKAPTKAGYEFIGWFNGDNEFPSTKSVVKNLKLYAKWRLESYDITYELKGGVVNNPTTYNIETPTFILNEPLKEGFTFIGWTKNSDSVPFKKYPIETGTYGNLNMTAHYLENNEASLIITSTYGGTYQINIDNFVNGQTIAEGTNVVLNAITNTDYEFIGWYCDEVLLSGDETYAFTMTKECFCVEARYQKQLPTIISILPCDIGLYSINTIWDKVMAPTQVTAVDDCNNNILLDVTWDKARYDASISGRQEIKGVVEIPKGYNIGEGVESSVKLIVQLVEDTEYTKGLLFKKKDGYYSVSVGGAKDESTIIIPKYYNDSIVCEIEEAGFANSVNLKRIYFHDMIYIISPEAFKNCSNLEVINIPAMAMFISNNLFPGCDNLKRITVDVDNEFYDSRNNSNAIILTAENKLIAGCKGTVIPDTVTTIGEKAFFQCTGLKTIDIPANVEEIKSNAFANCSNLEVVNIASGLITLNALAFADCTNVKEIKLPTTLRFFDMAAFSGWGNHQTIFFLGRVAPFDEWNLSCSSCHAVIVWDSTEIGELVYKLNAQKDGYIVSSGTTVNMTDIVIPRSYNGLAVVEIASRAFVECTRLERITISDTIKTIGNQVFMGCSNLKSVTIPGSAINLGNNIFKDCINLETVTFLNGVNIIPSGTFNGCKKLTSVSIPTSVVRIENLAFVNCTGLKTLYIPGIIEYIGNNAFELFKSSQTIYFTGMDKASDLWHIDWYKNSFATVVWNN